MFRITRVVHLLFVERLFAIGIGRPFFFLIQFLFRVLHAQLLVRKFQ
ncbi:hypothetical protein K8Z41_24445 [Bacillus thuringiensis]|nr:hypothetical protein [Bacillus cereus]UEK90980.1 hypothetical protein K8Z41_24445 [Bacillus thuringiensis]HDR6370157.1 hypothetical protein [Bacillus thuringiensis]